LKLEEDKINNDPKLKTKKKVIEAAKKWKPLSRKDEYRVADAWKDGGFQLTDKTILQKYRTAGKEIIKGVGRHILQGKLNLTTVSFPIKCMQHQTIL